MQYSQWHPYREPRDLSGLIPPDRRVVKTAILAVTCFLGGALLLAIAEVAMAGASAEPSGRWVHYDRDLELLNKAVVTTTVPASYPAAPRSTPTEMARDALLRGDPAFAKSVLINQVAAGKGSADDERLLRVACDALHDRACLDFLASRR